MAAYLRTRLPHFRHAALSLHKAKILPRSHSCHDATALLPTRTANVRAFHNENKQDGIDDHGTLSLHDSVKQGMPPVSGKKVDDGGVLEPHAVEKGRVTNFNLDAADDGGAQILHASKCRIEDILSILRASYYPVLKARLDAYIAEWHERDEIDKLKKGQSGKTTKKRVKRVPNVVSLCNATSVYEIRTFPPEVLKDNRRLRQLFKAWMKEWNVSYGSKGVEMDKFEDFKFNVFRNDSENRARGVHYRLGLNADIRPGYNWICRRVLDDERSHEQKRLVSDRQSKPESTQLINDNEQDRIDDDGPLSFHDFGKKGLPPVLVKKVDDGGALESHAVVLEKGKITDSKLDVADDGGAQDFNASEALIERVFSRYLARDNDFRCQELDGNEKPKKKEKCGKTTKKRVPVVVSLCNATRVCDIVRFPPEVLHDNRRLLQLFKAWKKEWNVRYPSNAEEMDKFEHFKFNVAWYDEENKKVGREYRTLGPSADWIPGYNWIGRKPYWSCCGASRR